MIKSIIGLFDWKTKLFLICLIISCAYVWHTSQVKQAVQKAEYEIAISYANEYSKLK